MMTQALIIHSLDDEEKKSCGGGLTSHHANEEPSTDRKQAGEGEAVRDAAATKMSAIWVDIFSRRKKKKRGEV